ncbi:MAG TPA: LCP family protein [Negativicutes bacterium]|nr:LCP family protein [Negativicutes bacterium]
MRSRLDTTRPHRKIRWARLFLVLAVLIVLITAFAGAAFYAYLNLFDTTAGTGGSPSAAGGQTADPALNKRVNILVLGIDYGDNETPGAPKRSDTMIVASVDPVSGTVSMLSIPRDTRVAIPGRTGYDKIAHAYAYGGPQLSARTVEEFLGVPINYYVTMDWQGFISVVDILGGVDMYVEDNMNYDDPYGALSIHLKKGYQHLDGEKAGQYVRFRHDELGDIGRVQRQQRFLKAMIDEMLQVGTLFKLPALTATIRQYVASDMPPLVMLRLANTLKGFRDGGLKAELLPGKFATIDGLSYWVPDKEGTKALVRDLFSTAGGKVSGTLPGATRTN